MRACDVLTERFRDGKGSDGRVTVLVVDEVDLLVTRTQQLLYNLFDWPTHRRARLVILGIANTLDLPERLLPKIISRLGSNRVAFAPYKQAELKKIVAARLEEAGGTVRNPSGYVMKAVERVRRGGTAGWNGAVGRCATCGAQGHLARDCPSAARGAPLDSLASLPPPPSARGNMAPRPDYPRPDQRRGLGPDEWICGACGGDNFARRRECRRCGTPKSSGEHWETNYGFQVPRPTPPRRRSSSRSRSRSRERRGRRGRRS